MSAELTLELKPRVLDRTRRGLYRSCVSERYALPYLRGRLDVEEALARPHRVRLILMSGICTERTLPLHALCRFFLESSGPTREPGGMRMLPFHVDMARLFELFFAEWMEQHLPRTLLLRSQDIVRICSTGSVEFRIDLTLHDADSDTCLAVMDTKYKTTDMPTSDDVAQIIAYAVARGARTGVLR